MKPAETVKNLGVWFYSEFTFSKHVPIICKSCFVHTRDLCRLQHYLSQDALIMAANALVGSRLDYCKSLFRDQSASNIKKLQCFHNSLARIVTNSSKLPHITPVRKKLHWLPIESRAMFNMALLVYKFVHTGTPGYFTPFLKPRSSAYRACNYTANSITLDIPQYIPSLHKSTNHFSASFSFDAPKIWNDLPVDICSAPSLMSFRRRLKAYLF